MSGRKANARDGNGAHPPLQGLWLTAARKTAILTIASDFSEPDVMVDNRPLGVGAVFVEDGVGDPVLPLIGTGVDSLDQQGSDQRRLSANGLFDKPRTCDYTSWEMVCRGRLLSEIEILRKMRGVKNRMYFYVWIDPAHDQLQWAVMPESAQTGPHIIDQFLHLSSYTGIRELVDAEPAGDDLEMYCGCVLSRSVSCGADCTLRRQNIECRPDAHRGRDCGNKAVSKFLTCGAGPTMLLDYTHLGIGIRTAVSLKIGQVVGVYWGKIVLAGSRQEVSSAHSYLAQLTDKFWIDASREGSILRYINSSCNPNLRLERWSVAGSTHLVYKAARRIRRGEALTISCDASTWALECKCASLSPVGPLSNECGRPNSSQSHE